MDGKFGLPAALAPPAFVEIRAPVWATSVVAIGTVRHAGSESAIHIPGLWLGDLRGGRRVATQGSIDGARAVLFAAFGGVQIRTAAPSTAGLTCFRGVKRRACRIMNPDEYWLARDAACGNQTVPQGLGGGSRAAVLCELVVSAEGRTCGSIKAGPSLGVDDRHSACPH